MGGTFDNDGKLTKTLKSLFNRNRIFEYDTQLEPLDAPYVAKKINRKHWCLNSAEDLMLQKNLSGKWIVLYEFEVYTPYVINEGMVETYGLVSPTNHEVQTIRARRKNFLQNGLSQSRVQGLSSIGFLNRKIGKRLYSYDLWSTLNVTVFFGFCRKVTCTKTKKKHIQSDQT